MTGAAFNDIAARLGPDFDCHAPDLPGHGANKTQPSLDACAALTRDWVNRLDRPILVGWSMGAATAWRYIAQQGTAAIRGLVTIDMSPRMLPDHTWDLGLIGQSAEAILSTSEKIIPNWPQMATSISRNMYAKDSYPILSRDHVKQLLQGQDPAVLRRLWDDLVAMDARATIAQIDLPYLVCCGAQSRLYSRKVADWIAVQAQQVQVASFEHSGHSPHLEEPDAFCAALTQFISDSHLATPDPQQAKT
jgi:pimeloyl-[acyl-carrier protein] methyl ester esterase